MKKNTVWILLLAMLLIFVGCGPVREPTREPVQNPPEPSEPQQPQGSLVITNGSTCTMEAGDTLQLECATENIDSEVVWSETGFCVDVTSNGLVTARREGVAIVTASAGALSDSIEITVTAKQYSHAINLYAEKQEIAIGEKISLSAEYLTDDPADVGPKEFEYAIVSGSEHALLVNEILTGLSVGSVTVVAKCGDFESNMLAITIVDFTEDPYIGMSKEEFYGDYEPAKSYMDSYYRTLHGFMSGDISTQDQAPTISDYQPMIDGLFVRNTGAHYSEDGNTYYVVNAYGEIVNHVYRGGGYVTLEEVAAYVFAFGDVPANYTENKSGKPQTSEWGEYLRLNHSYFSGNTKTYPYEPLLPNIRGAGGQLYYYEIDIGTTGTDCDPAYPAELYNDGRSISRGAARIVYTRYDANNRPFTDVNEKYLFYTYNHYNDFQEYLNYEGGWGEMFGNITGGGTISSKYHYNPTDYVPTERRDFYTVPINHFDWTQWTNTQYAT